MDDVDSRDPAGGLKSEARTVLLQWATQQRNGQHAQEHFFLRIPGPSVQEAVAVGSIFVTVAGYPSGPLPDYVAT
ncbi:uncharacterized protein LOC142578558 isoform X2 [Dermacentor variabilis]|uniref:uncharacterized protein LOC142578558 isoform X2 n=1 Tax=Dermacentor variabilis TaxID=34621 RepID=UPI003F5BFBF7